MMLPGTRWLMAATTARQEASRLELRTAAGAMALSLVRE
jgi:hypothetical protein